MCIRDRCGSDDTKDVSGEDGDVNSNQYLQVQPNGLNVIKVDVYKRQLFGRMIIMDI